MTESTMPSCEIGINLSPLAHTEGVLRIRWIENRDRGSWDGRIGKVRVATIRHLAGTHMWEYQLFLPEVRGDHVASYGLMASSVSARQVVGKRVTLWLEDFFTEDPE